MAWGSISWPAFLYRTRPRGQDRFTGQPFIDAALRGKTAPGAREGITEADYHADVQRILVDALRAAGNTVEENIRLVAKPNATQEWRYDVDAVFLPSCDRLPQLMEFKTSLAKFSYNDFDGSEFRRKQFEVIVLANIGAGVSTSNIRAANVNIEPNKTMPPTAVTIVYAIPGKIYDFSYVPPGDFKKLMDMAE